MAHRETLRSDSRSRPQFAHSSRELETGICRIASKRVGRSTKLDKLSQSGCLKALFPKRDDDEFLEAILANSSGGIAGGDCLTIHVCAGAETKNIVTTQAFEKVYRTRSQPSTIRIRLQLGRDAQLFWVPQETILFGSCHLNRRLDVEISHGASFLAAEPFLLGRPMHEDHFASGKFEDVWSINGPNGLIHAEQMLFEESKERSLRGIDQLDQNRAGATITAMGPAFSAPLEQIRSCLGNFDQILAGASQWVCAGIEKFVIRVLAPSGYLLRQALNCLLQALAPNQLPPKVWTL